MARLDSELGQEDHELARLSNVVRRTNRLIAGLDPALVQRTSAANNPAVSRRTSARLPPRRTFADEHIARRPDPASRLSTADNLSQRPPTANPNRPRATPSERYLRRSQARIREQRSADMDAAADLPRASGDAPYSNSFLMSNTNPHARSPIVEINSERRNKRRKLEHDHNTTPEYTCYKYGHKGQVVPGRLRMEIVSCDGGEHRKENSPGLYRVQNVLRNDKSVYCSESSQCNLLLKHMGEASFALEKLVIRAPDRGFTAP